MRLAVHPASKWLRRSPSRIYLTAVALSVLPLSFFLLAAHNLFHQQATARLVGQAAQSGKLIGNQVERHLHESEIFLQSLALRSDIIRDWEAHNYAQLGNRLRQVHALRSQYRSIGLYELDGTPRVISPPSPATLNQTFSSREWYAGLHDDPKPYISSVYAASSSDHEPVVAVAVPLLDEKGTPLGILMARETLDAITQEVYGLMTSPNTSLIFFVDQKGQVFGKNGDHVDLLPGLQPMMKAIGRPEKPTSQRLTLNGNDYVVAYSPIASLQWATLIQVPKSVITTALWAYEAPLALLGAIIILVALGGGIAVAFLYRKLRSSEERYLHQIERQNREMELRRREAEHANQMKSRFLATMSHELRTPLNAILGFASLLQDEPALTSKQKRWMEHIRQAGQHLVQLVNDVLDLSKIEAGAMELHKEKFAIDRAVPEVTSILSPLVAAKQIRLNVLIEGDLWVDADRIRFKQILYNLLSNAVKFTPPEGRVELRARGAEQSVVFTVSDTGVGIRPEDQERIFQEFGRLRQDTEGTGLGLSITRKLVDRHGGELQVKSELGEGTTFTFTLPVAQNVPNTGVAS